MRKTVHSWPELPRRKVLAGGALGAVALLSGLSCAATQTPAARTGATGSPRKIGVALLGLGDYSESQLAPALQKTQHCELRGIVTGTPSKVEKWQSKYAIPDANVYNYESLARIANNPDIDVVYVVTPTALHAKFTVLAAEAGKHVWCEKPMAMSAAECQRMIDACRKNKVQLAIGYRLHHEPNTQRVMQYAKDKPYGAIKEVSALAGDKSNGEDTWRMHANMGGGALYDMGVYSVNAIHYATNDEPVRVVRARQWAERPDLFREVDEITEFELELKSGIRAYGKGSRGDNDNKLEVKAERGAYHLEPMQAYSGVSGETSDGVDIDLEIDNQQAKQMDDDAQAILAQSAPKTPGEIGLRDVRVIEAIIQAAKTGAPVDI